MSELESSASREKKDLEKQVWTIAEVLRWSNSFLRDKGFQAPRVDVELLLAHTMGCQRIELYTRFEQPLSLDERQVFRQLLQRRAVGEPVAYILGTKEFYGREFFVDKRVLIPRPETEGIVDRVLTWCRAQPDRLLRVLDVGTGSGCLAVSIACELENVTIDSWDISREAIEVAQDNANRLEVGRRIAFHLTDAREKASWPLDSYDVIVSNPPYIAPTEKDHLMRDVRSFEPGQALFAGSQGMEFYELFAEVVPNALRNPGLFVCELGFNQGTNAQQLFARQDKPCRLENDYAGIARYLIYERDPA